MGDERRKSGRHAVGLLVRLKYADVQTFVDRFATNISPGGMFILTRQPKPERTLVRFEVQIAGGLRVMRGEAIVRWVRSPETKSGPPGMGLEFVRLDAPTKAMLGRLLEARGEGPEAPAAEAAHEAGPEAPASEGAHEAAPEAPSTEAAPEAPALDVPPALDDAIDVDLDDLVRSTPPSEPPAEPAGEPDLDVDLDLDVDVDLSDGAEAEPKAPAVPGPLRPVFLEPPEEIPDEGPIIGIDLGTTNSCVGVSVDGRPAVVRSREGYNTIPSVVALNRRDRLLVGHPAKSQMLTNPARTVYGAKRLVGRPFESHTVRMVRERFHYDVCPDAQGKAAVHLGDDVVALEEIQGLVLRECKEMAQIHLERPVHRAVITVPAYYSDAQRQAVREAGRLAGLKVERILNEPTAAALAYGLNRDLRRRVLIYDLGGGTFDATAMSIEGNVFEVLATGGDTFLGGVDFDDQIVDWLLQKFEETTGKAFNGDPVALARVADAAENAKIALSESQTKLVHVPFLMVDEDGAPHDLKVTMTREDLEALVGPLVDRTLDVVRDVLLDADVKPSEIEEVILVGGQSRMPLVRERLKILFGRDAHPGVHPDEAVALGAALLAGSLDKVSSVVLVDVLPMTIGVGLPGGRFKRIIERNTPLPVTKTYGIATTRDDQAFLEVSVFQGEAEHVSGDEYLGTLRLDGLPKGARGSVRVAVTFELGPECVLRVQAREMKTGREVAATLATRDTPDELKRRLGIDEASAEAAHSARDEELQKRGGRFWGFVKRILGNAA